MHAWPEYYDQNKQLWIGVDPTWANTTGGIDYFSKLDFNHIVFAINGKNDSYPYPAGSYRPNDVPGKYVQVKFADSSEAKHLQPKLLSTLNFPTTVISGLTTKGSLTIKNTTGVGLNDIKVSISSIPKDVNVTKTIDHIPPFTTQILPISFSSHSFFQQTKGQIRASINSEIVKKEFIIRPIYLIIIIVCIGLGIILVILWFINHHPIK
jgi:hypothetical protein